MNLRSHIRVGCVGCYQYANLILSFYGGAKYGIYQDSGGLQYLEVARIMHQSIPAAPRSLPPPPPPPLSYCGAFAWLVSPGGGAIANFALPGGQASAYPGAIPRLLTRMWFPI